MNSIITEMIKNPKWFDIKTAGELINLTGVVSLYIADSEDVNGDYALLRYYGYDTDDVEISDLKIQDLYINKEIYEQIVFILTKSTFNNILI